jgi:hypothetical protein
MPLSKWLYKINPHTGTPVVSVLFCATFAMLLGLLAFAGSAAIGAIFTMGIVCIYIAYCIPIAARHLGGQEFLPGPFYLGKLVSVYITQITYKIAQGLVPEPACLIYSCGIHVHDDRCPLIPYQRGAHRKQYELHGRCRRGDPFPQRHLLFSTDHWRKTLVHRTPPHDRRRWTRIA